MSRIVILGAGVSGHTAAAFARHWLGRQHDVTVVSPRADYNWIPSNIWVGVGLMKPAQVTFPLAPVYERAGIRFVQARAVALHPEGDVAEATPFVVVESTLAGQDHRRLDPRATQPTAKIIPRTAPTTSSSVSSTLKNEPYRGCARVWTSRPNWSIIE